MQDIRILVVDDEPEIADLVELYLANEGFAVQKYYDPSKALQAIAKTPFSLAVLDVMMPGTDGFSLLREIRKNHAYPVIMLTAKVENIDKITGLNAGADDYITKPFHPLEMTARVKAQLRRYLKYNEAAERKGEVIDFSGLVIDRANHACTLYGKPLALTPTEFSILWLLCENRGRVISSEELFTRVWGEEYLESNNTVMVHIRRLREKMGEPPRAPKFIKTVWGVGYKIEN